MLYRPSDTQNQLAVALKLAYELTSIFFLTNRGVLDPGGASLKEHVEPKI
jgi:hypothetical protein